LKLQSEDSTPHPFIHRHSQMPDSSNVLKMLQKRYGLHWRIADPISYSHAAERIGVAALDWSTLPDLGAVVLLTCAFASVARRSTAQASGLWLTGWVMITLHFAAFMFLSAPGALGAAAQFVGLAALVWAGVLFMWAAVPYHGELSSRYMLAVLLGTNTLYVGLVSIGPSASWALAPAAALFCILPLALALLALRQLNHPLRWVVVTLYSSLTIFLLIFQHRSGNGADLALHAVLFTVYLGCCIHFWYAYRRATTGALITIAGFLAWAAVFVVSPSIAAFLPNLHLESEVWNLPKYVVAVGMILLLLEDQIEHNKFLALHDELTGLPNRRLFQDRLASALERARRSGAQTALLLVDLNHFKQVNDTFGHHVGDLLLKRVGAMFTGRVRRTDTVARTGGDEFSIILEEPTTRKDAEGVGHSLIQLLCEPLELDDRTVRIGASVGIAVFPEDALTTESLCIAADLRMYGDKHESKRPGQPARPHPPQRPPMAEAQTGLHREWR
jgi:diguanylate cyclase (GGDEF)-like protein